MGPPFLNGRDQLYLLDVDEQALEGGDINIAIVRIDEKEMHSAGNFVATMCNTSETIGSAAASTVVGGVTSFAGGMIGATVGALIPGIGTLVGGPIGNFLGSIFGGFLGFFGISGETCFAGFLPGEANNFAKQEANFNASGYAHISPTGELMYYATSFYNRGPGGITRRAEFSHNNKNGAGSCAVQDGTVSAIPETL